MCAQIKSDMFLKKVVYESDVLKKYDADAMRFWIESIFEIMAVFTWIID